MLQLFSNCFLKLLPCGHWPVSIQTVSDWDFLFVDFLTVLAGVSECLLPKQIYFCSYFVRGEVLLTLSSSGEMETAFSPPQVLCLLPFWNSLLSPASPTCLPQLLLWCQIKTHVEGNSSLEKSNPQIPLEYSKSGEQNLRFEIVSELVVYKIMNKQKVFNVINPNFSKHINVFHYLFMLSSETKHFVLMLSYLQRFYGNQLN